MTAPPGSAGLLTGPNSNASLGSAKNARLQPGHRNATPPLKRALPWIVAAAILLLHAALVLWRLDHFSWRDDEAVLLLTARAAQLGHPLYDTVWFNYPPGLVLLFRAAFAIGGDGLLTARAAVLMTASLALLLTFAAARTAGEDDWAGVGAISLLAIAPHFLSLSGAVMAEVPTLGLATGAIWAILRYTRSRRTGWIVASGALFGLALLIKPTPIFAGGTLALAIWLTETTWGRRLRGWAILGAAIIVPLATGILAVNPVGFARQFGSTYLESKGAFGLDLFENLGALADYVLSDKYNLCHVGLLALATSGLVSLWRRARRVFWVLAAWVVLVLVALISHSPLYRHHLLQLLIPLCVLGGIGVGAAMTRWRGSQQPRRRALAAALLLALGVEAVLCLQVDLFSLGAIESDQIDLGQQVVRFLDQNTPVGSTIITDGHILAVRAGRDVPPELTNTARMRIKTGMLTDQDVIDIARRDRPAAIVFWEKKLDSLDDWATWVACRYDLALQLDDRHRVYLVRPPIDVDSIARPMAVDMGAGMRLRGYDVNAVAPAPGQRIDLTLYWEAVEPPSADLTVFVHLADGRENTIAQHDGVPRGGACPTWIWQPGEIIVDQHSLDVEHMGAGAPFTLYAGLYDRRTGQRTPSGRVMLTHLP